MIDRFSIHATQAKLKERFALEETAGYKARYNAAPGCLLPVITHQSPQGFSFFYWGAPPQFIKNKTVAERIINVRAELIPEKPVLKKTMMKYRCLVPLSGFFGWKKIGKKTSVPWYIFSKSGALLSAAGLWEEYDDPDGNSFHTFTLITVPSNKVAGAITERMPVILLGDAERVWLNQNSTEADLIPLMVSCPDALLDSYTVSPAINSTSYESALLIEPAPAADQFGNLTLFN